MKANHNRKDSAAVAAQAIANLPKNNFESKSQLQRDAEVNIISYCKSTKEQF
ncbi:MAG: hypothetical protein IRZ03_18575 [Acidobacterium ailaaui]|nr:hypothetical protein [Pseudacidobacterium ailaaui]